MFREEFDLGKAKRAWSVTEKSDLYLQAFADGSMTEYCIIFAGVGRISQEQARADLKNPRNIKWYTTVFTTI